eukprot:CAMPEP_0194538812 /NCGR_PEP_ID=MMETSP0253-20130528/78495_1 /TAXON_ID=2966 /ORGANISM="Noctiluca scintillans" /LENGTH=260 /DNA_ID=CAMNT_0039384993 /DNA_START=92 /DNA_END=871 /DNA_ORIENTATION=+
MAGSVGERRIAMINKTFGDQTETYMMLVSSQHVFCMLDNFILHADGPLKGRTVVHFALDGIMQNYCQRRAKTVSFHMICLDFSGLVPDVDQNVKSRDMDNAGFGSCVYKMMIWARPVILLHAARVARRGVLSMDDDIVLFRGEDGSIMDWVERHRRHDVQLVGGCAGPCMFPNGGTIFVNRNSTSLIEQWLSQAPKIDEPTGDQAGLHALLRSNKTYWLPKIQIIERAVLGQNGRVDGVYGTHFDALPSKVDVMKERGMW